MGSAALYQAAKRGARVLGIDRFDPPHEMGSSHAETRITRLAVGEGPAYVPLVARSHEIWRELEAQSGEELLIQNGLYIIVPKTFTKLEYNHWENFVERSAEMAEQNELPYELRSAAEIRAHHPQIFASDNDHSIFEPTAGVVMSERAIAMQIKLAKQMGADVLPNSPVSAVEQNGDQVIVRVADESFSADKVIVSAGPWASDFVPELQKPNFRVTRQVVYWFEVEDLDRYSPENFPSILWVGETLEEYFGAFTVPAGSTPGLKLLTEQYVDAFDPNTASRTVEQHEIDWFYENLASKRLAGVKPNCIKAKVCLYTNTPDDNFLLDWHPESDRVLIASPCSGHGFKHSAAIGEGLVQMALDGKSQISFEAFKFDKMNR